jgi:SAM-dependent methyltransferase
LHVLEHSNDLERTLSEIKEFLVPGGKVVFAVPNFESSGYRDQGMRWVWAQPPLIHIFHFTAAGLTALLARHGFDNIQISYHERWDANHHADVLHAEHFRRWDAAWGLRGFRSIPGYRKLVAAINSRRRYRALEKSMDTPMKDRAELQVSAALAIK